MNGIQSAIHNTQKTTHFLPLLLLLCCRILSCELVLHLLQVLVVVVVINVVQAEVELEIVAILLLRLFLYVKTFLDLSVLGKIDIKFHSEMDDFSNSLRTGRPVRERIVLCRLNVVLSSALCRPPKQMLSTKVCTALVCLRVFLDLLVLDFYEPLELVLYLHVVASQR